MAAAELSPCRTHVSIGVSNQDRKTSFNYLADTFIQYNVWKKIVLIILTNSNNHSNIKGALFCQFSQFLAWDTRIYVISMEFE